MDNLSRLFDVWDILYLTEFHTKVAIILPLLRYYCY